MYGTQTIPKGDTLADMFENDVKMYGTQTKEMLRGINRCLRMM